MDSEKKTLSRVERRQAATKRKVVQAALRLIAAQGYDATTMEQIAEEADIAKGTLYNYFPAKEAILSAYVQQTLQQGQDERLRELRALADSRARVTYAFKTLLAGVQRQQEIFEKVLVYRMQQMAALQREARTEGDLSSLSAVIIQLGQQAGEMRTDIPPFILQELFEFIFVEIVKQFYQDPDAFDVDPVIAQYADLFLNGVQRTSTRRG